MLDYAMISKSKGYIWGNLDATIAFLQTCPCVPEFAVHVLTRRRHVQTSPSLPPLQPQSPLPLRILRLLSTPVLLPSRNNWLK